MSASYIDLRSDTVTKPTDEMREAMRNAEVGDEGRKEDPTVNGLEELATSMLSKEAALLVPSGTMANLVALMTHCARGQEVILDSRAHIYWYEVGGISSIAGLIPRLVESDQGILNPKDVVSSIRPKIPHFPVTGLVSLENSHNLLGGISISPTNISAVCDVAHRNGIPVHLDGARIFNAAISMGVKASEIAEDVDSVMFCLSKGLSAPIGSVLCGSKEFIERARTIRLLLGGGMRQAGVIASAGIVALEQMIDRLHIDHQNARALANGLIALDFLSVNLATVHTNIVMVKVDSEISAGFLRSRLEERGIGCLPEAENHLRFVTHRHITSDDISRVIHIAAELVKTIRPTHKD